MSPALPLTTIVSLETGRDAAANYLSRRHVAIFRNDHFGLTMIAPCEQCSKRFRLHSSRKSCVPDLGHGSIQGAPLTAADLVVSCSSSIFPPSCRRLLIGKSIPEDARRRTASLTGRRYHRLSTVCGNGNGISCLLLLPTLTRTTMRRRRTKTHRFRRIYFCQCDGNGLFITAVASAILSGALPPHHQRFHEETLQMSEHRRTSVRANFCECHRNPNRHNQRDIGLINFVSSTESAASAFAW